MCTGIMFFTYAVEAVDYTEEAVDYTEEAVDFALESVDFHRSILFLAVVAFRNS